MRQGKDSVSWPSIPVGTPVVMGYVAPSRFAWPAAAWTRFVGSVLVRITPSAGTHGLGVHVLDVETGDATPAQVPGWVLASRGAGQEPTVYTALGNWAAVIQACINAGVIMPQWWIADWNGIQTLPSITVHGVTYTAVAKQYADPAHGSGGNWDSSVVADQWPGVDTGVGVDEMSFDLTTPVAVPQLDAQGNYIGDLKDSNGQTVTAPFIDFVRFGDIEVQRSNQLIVALTAVVTNLAAAQGQQFTGDQVKGWIEDAVAAHPTTINITGVAGTTAAP